MPPILGNAPRRDGRELAARQVLGPSTLRERAVKRSLRRLDRAFARLFGSSRLPPGDGAGVDLTSAVREWLYENDFVVAEALETLDGALPARFLNNLPGLREPESQRGSPRAQVLAEELVRRGRGRVEVGEVVLFLEGYQEVRSLRLAELWALPAFLRLALLEDLAERTVADDGMVKFGPYILSLRILAGEDWRGVVESLSLVDGVLREDPAALYARMDFRTRDRYRGGVEKVARLIKQPEDTVARQALELARSRAGEPLGAREHAEARIDSIAQSWSVISEATDPVRAWCAIDSAWKGVGALGRRDRPARLPSVHWERPGSRVYRGVSAGWLREWGSVHTRGGVARACPRSDGRWGQGRSPPEDDSSDSTFQRRGGNISIPCRAVCDRSGCLWGRASHRSGGMDLVHGLRWMDLAGRPRGRARRAEGGSLPPN